MCHPYLFLDDMVACMIVILSIDDELNYMMYLLLSGDGLLYGLNLDHVILNFGNLRDHMMYI